MKWKDLSNNAKSIIEWVQDPYTHKKRTIKITVGNYFQPMKNEDVKIFVTRQLYNEVLEYVMQDKELEYMKSIDGLAFKLKDEVEV